MSDLILSGAALDDAVNGPNSPDWELADGRLVKTVVCRGFLGALAFVGAVGVLAEEANHHPDIDIRYNRVTLALVTHDAGGITRKDIDLARAIDRLTEEMAEGVE